MITVYANGEVHVGGEIRASFPYDESNGIGHLLAFSDGTVLRAAATDENVWRLRRVIEGSACMDRIPAEFSGEDHSDWIGLDGEIDWVLSGQQLVFR